jgi:CBS domain-containing protein
MRIEQLNAMTSVRLATIDANATLRAAALSFSKPGIGLVVVCDKNGGAVGALTKSDLVRHLANSGSMQTTVATLMTQPIVHCSPDDDVHLVSETMAAQRLQNLPVLGLERRPLGILDIRDAMKVLFEQEELQEQLLTNYIAGIGYQ